MHKIIAGATTTFAQGTIGRTAEEILEQFRSARSVEEYERLLAQFSFRRAELPQDVVCAGVEGIRTFFIKLGLAISGNPNISHNFYEHFDQGRHLMPLKNRSYYEEHAQDDTTYPRKLVASLDDVFMYGSFPKGETFLAWLEHVSTQHEMRGLLQLICFWDDELPFDISSRLDRACFAGFLYQVYSKIEGTPRHQWFLAELDHDKHLVPLRTYWFKWLMIWKIEAIFPGLIERIIEDEDFV